jgi:hypothetical protein
MTDKPKRRPSPCGRRAMLRHAHGAMKSAIDADKLYSDADLLKVLTTFTESDLEQARDMGTLRYINVAGKGPRSRGWHVLDWIDDMLST